MHTPTHQLSSAQTTTTSIISSNCDAFCCWCCGCCSTKRKLKSSSILMRTPVYSISFHLTGNSFSSSFCCRFGYLNCYTNRMFRCFFDDFCVERMQKDAFSSAICVCVCVCLRLFSSIIIYFLTIICRPYLSVPTAPSLFVVKLINSRW